MNGRRRSERSKRPLWPVAGAFVLIVVFFVALGIALVTQDGQGETTDLRPSDAGLVCGAGTYRQPIYGRGYDLPDECRPAPTTGGDR